MMVYGSNASGKSNLIQSFDFVRSFVQNIPDDKEEETGFMPFMLMMKRKDGLVSSN